MLRYGPFESPLLGLGTCPVRRGDTRRERPMKHLGPRPAMIVVSAVVGALW